MISFVGSLYCRKRRPKYLTLYASETKQRFKPRDGAKNLSPDTHMQLLTSQHFRACVPDVSEHTAESSRGMELPTVW